MADLKPCPFCGDNKHVNYVELSNGLHYVECKRCGAAPHRLGAWDRETAVKYWNSANRWIPCSERLPESEREVLVYVKGDFDNSIPFITTAYINSDHDWQSDYDGEVIDSKISHWMPLPNEPEVTKDDNG